MAQARAWLNLQTNARGVFLRHRREDDYAPNSIRVKKKPVPAAMCIRRFGSGLWPNVDEMNSRLLKPRLLRQRPTDRSRWPQELGYLDRG